MAKSKRPLAWLFVLVVVGLAVLAAVGQVHLIDAVEVGFRAVQSM